MSQIENSYSELNELFFQKIFIWKFCEGEVKGFIWSCWILFYQALSIFQSYRVSVFLKGCPDSWLLFLLDVEEPCYVSLFYLFVSWERDRYPWPLTGFQHATIFPQPLGQPESWWGQVHVMCSEWPGPPVWFQQCIAVSCQLSHCDWAESLLNFGDKLVGVCFAIF